MYTRNKKYLEYFGFRKPDGKRTFGNPVIDITVLPHISERNRM